MFLSLLYSTIYCFRINNQYSSIYSTTVNGMLTVFLGLMPGYKKVLVHKTELLCQQKLKDVAQSFNILLSYRLPINI